MPCPSATTPPGRRCATRSMRRSPSSRPTARSRRSRRSGWVRTSPSPRLVTDEGPRPRLHDRPRAGHPALRAAHARHGGRRSMAIALVPRLGPRGHPRAARCRCSTASSRSSSASSAARRSSSSSSSSTTACRRSSGLPHLDRRRHRRDHGPDAAFLRLHGREHPRRHPRRRPQPVGGRRLGRHDPLQAMRRIILPQAARVAAPTLLNYFIDMIKSTSLAFTLGVTEMMGAAQKEAAGSFKYFEAFLVVALHLLGDRRGALRRAAPAWKSACTGPTRDDPRRGPDQALRRPSPC